MGICETKNNLNKQEENQANTQAITDNNSNNNGVFNKTETVLLSEDNKINNSRIPECLIKFSPFEKLDNNVTKVAKSICKVKIENILPNGIQTILGTGFLLKFWMDLYIFKCLVSNEHIIRRDIINNSINNIIIKYDSEFKIANIRLDKNKRFIESFKNIGLDITVVQILDEDNIPEDFFLYSESQDFVKNSDLIKMNIYIPQYAQGKELVNSRGSIIKVDKYEFTHLASTEHGSSGSPIFLQYSIEVIGIHKEGSKTKSENYGDFIYPIFDIIKKEINKKRYNGKYSNGRYIWDDGKYYIGEFKNNLPNGKGTKYHKNGKIEYEGDFINGKFEGKGKFIYYDDHYFIGQFKSGLRNGQGAKYYPNGNIQAEGNYINNQLEGYGKYYWEDGGYDIGQWRNGLMYGKGKEYYSNGKIKYEGEYLNDKREGKGKLIYEEEKCFWIGEFKNGNLNGKGKFYNSDDGKIIYEGEFINGKFEGNGKLFYNDGNYYIGQFKNHLQHGKGIEYYSNGKINYEGDFVDGEREGNGKCITENFYYIGQYKKGKPIKGKVYSSDRKILFYDGDFINGEAQNGIKIYKLDKGGYYVGQVKNGLFHGKGTLYNSDGTIKQKGNWNNDKYIGN